MMIAAEAGNVDILKLLLDSEPDLMQAAKKAHDILRCAVIEGKVPVVEFLLQRGTHVDDKINRLAREPVMTDLLRRATLLKAGQADDADEPVQPLAAGALMASLLDTAVRNKDADSWPKYMKRHDVSAALSSALESAADGTRSVWKSLAGQGQKITPAQQKNWCAGIAADLGNVMRREAFYSRSGLSKETQGLLETIAGNQSRALEETGLAAEQALRDGMENLLQTCMKAALDGHADPIALYKLLTMEHGIYHNVASMIVAAFSDVWPRRDSLGADTLEQAFAAKVLALKENHRTLQAMHRGTADAGNQETVSMLMFRQLDLLRAWAGKALASWHG
jgi:hypothetical protein